MAVSIRVNVDRASARAAIGRAVGAEVARRLNAEGESMVQHANDLMAQSFNLNRPFERRRSPGSRRASTALDYVVEGGGGLPARLGFRVLGGDDVLRRIIILNFGSRPHRIAPSGAWSLTGGRVQSRLTRGVNIRRSAVQPVLAWVDESGSAVTPEVDHPGTRGAGFLEKAAERSAVNLTR